MQVSDIEKHYVANRKKLVNRFRFRSGTEEDAEDIVQEAYERSLRYYKSYSGNEYDKWFNTILNNCFKEHKNAQNGHSADHFDEEEAEGTACPHYSEQVMREVYELIDTKSVIQQEILNLYFQQEYKAIDISRVTSYPYSQCHQIILRFRKELKDLYK